jgi:hypothetical protein
MKKLTMLILVALLASLFVGPAMQASNPTYSFNLDPPNTADERAERAATPLAIAAENVRVEDNVHHGC